MKILPSSKHTDVSLSPYRYESAHSTESYSCHTNASNSEYASDLLKFRRFCIDVFHSYMYPRNSVCKN